MKHLRKLLFLLALSLLLIGCGKTETNGNTTTKSDDTTTKSDDTTTKSDSEPTTKDSEKTTTKDDSEQEYNYYHVFDLNGVEVVKDKKYYAPGSSLTVTNSYSYDCYDFEGYYFNGEKVSDTKSANITTNLTGDTKIIAKFVPKSEMSIYEFTYEKVDDAEIITIIDVIDETLTKYVVPWYVTNINQGAFKGCSMMRELELPFCGIKEDCNRYTSECLLGVIFGSEQYDGSKEIYQVYERANGSMLSAKFYFPERLCNIRINRGALYYGSLSKLNELSLNRLSIGAKVTYVDQNALYETHNFQSVVVNYANTLYKSGANNDYIIEIDTDKLIYVPDVETVTLPSTLKIIGRSAFQYNSKMESIVLPDSVEEIEFAAFSNVSKLKSVTLPNGLKKIGADAFYNAKSLESINLPDSIEYIDGKAFNGCDSLDVETLVLPLSLKEMGRAVIVSNSNIKNIVVNKNLLNVGSGAFSSLSNLEGVYYNGTLDDYLKIVFETENSNFVYGSVSAYTHPVLYFLDNNGDIEFNGNKYSIPTKIVIDAEKVNSYAFLGINSITEVRFTNNVKQIGSKVFSTGNRTFIIPTSVTKLGSDPFYYTSNTLLYYEGTKEQWKAIEKGSQDNAYVMYYSDDEPSTDRAHYWHYDDDNNPKTWQ